MTEIKRIELVIDAALRGVGEDHQAGRRRVRLIKDVQGTGDRGNRSGDELGNVFRNCYLIVASDEATADAIVEASRPLLERYGGMCLVSDAMWVKHYTAAIARVRRYNRPLQQDRLRLIGPDMAQNTEETTSEHAPDYPLRGRTNARLRIGQGA